MSRYPPARDCVFKSRLLILSLHRSSEKELPVSFAVDRFTWKWAWLGVERHSRPSNQNSSNKTNSFFSGDNWKNYKISVKWEIGNAQLIGSHLWMFLYLFQTAATFLYILYSHSNNDSLITIIRRGLAEWLNRFDLLYYPGAVNHSCENPLDLSLSLDLGSYAGICLSH